MDLRMKQDFQERWRKYFGEAELPLTFWYADQPGAAEAVEPPKDHRCFLTDLKKVREGAGDLHLKRETEITPSAAIWPAV